VLSIFHPTDLSRGDELAFAHALRFAAAGASALTILHVDAPGEASSWDEFPSVRALLERWDFLDPGSTPEDVAQLGITVDKVEAISRDPLAAALAFLGDHPADVIVLGTEGRQGAARWWRGSIAEPLARGARSMTLFVPQRARGFVALDSGAVTLDNILVPVCRSPSPERALEAARAVSRALGVPDARVSACWVGPPDEAIILHGEDIPLAIRHGSVAAELVAAAEEQRANLIVMATAGHHGILDALRGSTTEQVLRQAPCPVLAVPVA
jgi:nucleotide-binding universal stress UspA family protein